VSSSTLSISLCRTKLLAAIFLHSYTLHFQIYFTCFPEKAPGVPDPPFCKQKIYCGYVNKQKQVQEIPFRVTGKACDVLAEVVFIWTLDSLYCSVEDILCREELSKCARRNLWQNTREFYWISFNFFKIWPTKETKKCQVVEPHLSVAKCSGVNNFKDTKTYRT